MDVQKDILVAQALPVFLGTDGPRVLLGQKSCGEKVNDILIQPFGGKPDPGEKLEKAGKREFIEEFEFGTTLEMLRRLFSKKNFLGVFSASSDVDPERILRIHCWGARFSSPFQVREKLGSEMKNPHWYRFSEVFKNPKSGTLTKLMVAFFGCVQFFDADCIAYLRDIALDKETPMGISNMALSALFEANRYKEKEYTLPVYADDRGLCTLLRHNSLLEGDALPQAVTFKGATPVSVTY